MICQIFKKGELIILTENSSTSYFNYRGKTMGFEYEILRDFAASLNLKLKVKVVNDSKKFDQMLNEKKGDIIGVIIQLKTDQIICHFQSLTLKKN